MFQRSKMDHLCPLCTFKHSEHALTCVSQPKGRRKRNSGVGDFGLRYFCTGCEFDFMVYSGRTLNMPSTLCDITMRNLRACQNAVLFALEKTEAMQLLPYSIVSMISVYSWFTIPACCFQNLPDFPRGADYKMLRVGDLSGKGAAAAVEYVVREITFPDDKLFLSSHDGLEGNGFTRLDLRGEIVFVGLDIYS
jgi:hypothetical protein